LAVNSLKGGCFCGAVRFECGEPVMPACFCHCTSCRRASGAHVVAWVTVKFADFRLTAGTLRKFVSSKRVLREFCGSCGTPVTYSNMESTDTIDVTLGSFDDASAIRPIDHVWMDDAPAWDRPQDGLPQLSSGRAAAKPFEG
jgi:hypothetical protein